MNARICLFILFTSLWLLPARAQVQGKVALVIGNTHYTNAVPLTNPENDANDMCAALRKIGFEVICKLDIASKREFKDAIYTFSGKIDRHTVAVFYFAGHGMQMEGVNYLIPVHAALRTKSDIEDESVQINYLMSELEARQAALNIFIIDACRNNPLADPIRGYVPTLGMASQLYAPRNSIIAMSTGAGQLSLDGNGRNGTFTKNLLQHISTPQLAIEDMLKAVSKGTRADANRFGLQQDPQMTISYAEKFCLAGCDDGLAARQANLVKEKTTELLRLEASIADTRSKQAQVDAQQAALVKKRAELEQLSQGLEHAQLKQEEVQRQRAILAQRERELQKLRADIKTSTDQLGELESVRTGLLKKQEEVERMRKSLTVQQASIDAANKDIQTRAIRAPEKTSQPITVVPAF